MEARAVFRALRAGWGLLVVGLLLGAALGWGVSLLQTPKYETATQLFVSPTDSSTASEALQGSQLAQQRVPSYAQLITGPDLARRVIHRLGLTMTPKQLTEEIKATVAPDTVLINVTVTDSSPGGAQRIAEAVGTEFPTLVAQLEGVQGAGTPPIKVTVTFQPERPVTPSSPHTVRNIVIGSLAGLLLSAVAVVSRAAADRTVRSPVEATELASTPFLGLVVRDKRLRDGHLVHPGDGGRAEDFRRLRARLSSLEAGEPPLVLMVASALPQEGKTTVAINLGMALAETGRTVTVVEADIRSPSLAHLLGLPRSDGLAQILAGTVDVDDAVQPYGSSNLSIIPAGETPVSPGALISSGNLAPLLDKLRGSSDYVLVDTPPVLSAADSSELAPMVDGVLLVVRYGHTREEHLQNASATLLGAGAKTLGVVLTMVPEKAARAAAPSAGEIHRKQPGRQTLV